MSLMTTEQVEQLESRLKAAQAVVDQHFTALRALRSAHTGLRMDGCLCSDPVTTGSGDVVFLKTVKTPFFALLQSAAKTRNALEAELREARNGKFKSLVPAGHVECKRCGGFGGHSQWPGFVCFDCGGNGFVPGD